MSYIIEEKESVYVFPEASGGNNASQAFHQSSISYDHFAGVDLTGYTTVYVEIDSSGQNWGDIFVPYSSDQGSHKAPPSNITKMILKRKNGGNTRIVKMMDTSPSHKINGVTQSAWATGFTLGTNGVETLVFERNEADITNNNWRVYSI